jgi:excisionase family DNA binding protein
MDAAELAFAIANTSMGDGGQGMNDHPVRSPEWRESLRAQALRNAMQKRAAGVPTYSVPEAAALLSISQEYLYRLIQSNGFPAVRMRFGAGQGRYVVPAKAIEQLLDGAAAAGACVESAAVTEQWRNGVAR